MAEDARAAADGSPTRRGRRHRVLVDSLLALATLIGVVAVLAVWVNRQALNTDNWTNTSSELLANKQIDAALSAYLVNQLFHNVDVAAEIKSFLPTQLQGLAGPAASGLQQLAGQLAPQLLESAQVQSAWRQANKAAHQTFLKIINGGGKLASTNGGVVTLNLHAIEAQLAATLGVQSQVAAVQSKLSGSAGASAKSTVQKKLGITLPPSSGELVIMRSSDLKTTQDIAGAIKGLAIALPLIAFALFILAVWLADGWRREALRTVGWCFVGIGILTLLVRRVAGNEVVDALVKVPSNKPAVHDVWTIATTLLYDIAVAMVVYGLVIVVAAWIAGRTRPATAIRRALAPTLRERPVAVYAFAAVAFLLILLWGPTPALRQPIPIIGIAILLVFGIEALRRKTAAEFPDSQPGDTVHALKAWYANRRHPKPAPANGERIADLERLAGLHDRGVLSDSEFESQKALIVNGS